MAEGVGEETTQQMTTTKTTSTTKTTTTTQQSNSAREREGLMMTAAIGSWRLAMLATIDANGHRHLRGRTMAEVLGDVSGGTVANGSKQRWWTRAAEDNDRGRVFVG